MWSHQAPDEACPQTAFTLSFVDGASTQRCFQAQMSASLGLKINQQFDTRQPTGGRSFAAWLLHKVYLHPPTTDLQTPAEGLKYRGIEARAPSVHSAQRSWRHGSLLPRCLSEGEHDAGRPPLQPAAHPGVLQGQPEQLLPLHPGGHALRLVHHQGTGGDSAAEFSP